MIKAAPEMNMDDLAWPSSRLGEVMEILANIEAPQPETPDA